MTIVTYVYYGWLDLYGLGIKAADPQQYMIDLHKIVESGYFGHVDYCGQMNCTCGGAEEFGVHYGMVLVADEKTTREILDLIENDYMEAFEMKTMEKLNKNLKKVELSL